MEKPTGVLPHQALSSPMVPESLIRSRPSSSALHPEPGGVNALLLEQLRNAVRPPGSTDALAAAGKVPEEVH